MNDFTKSEVDEIYSYIDFTKGMSIDGKDITCFKSLYSIASDGKKIVTDTRKVVIGTAIIAAAVMAAVATR